MKLNILNFSIDKVISMIINESIMEPYVYSTYIKSIASLLCYNTYLTWQHCSAYNLEECYFEL